ncbi:two-component system, chemotaxis family, response regulator CheY [Palleronia marisminoris]|uniref:Chemotaxis protein CheY n=1 Tax=Palleronia marisminoris TaxID=315423 RepID=A0A1Y5R7S7_9RHOB|nr:response regulator [Palleronia marisminoris]SFG07225.1 two-component system, chemotaxis family, response regulator CheY [Palleronia marisminoris]SLN11112.1 Chemotaxis protein CheY [Palleronia marisminoris]
MSKTILSVDDSKSIRDMIGFTLQPKGYDVIGAGDGLEGIAALKANKVNLVVCDLNMPNMNGLEMVRKVREDRSFDGIPIVMLTTEAQKEKMLAAKEAGAAGWLVKPFDEAKLVSVVNKMIGGAQ